MILANSTWGSWLAELGVPGIYRSQASLAPGVKVRMGTKALPHAGIGVTQLRLEHLAAAPLHRPGEPVANHRLRAPWQHGRAGRALQAQGRRRCSPSSPAFDAAYSAYNGLPRRAWSGSGRSRYLQQHRIAGLTATDVQSLFQVRYHRPGPDALPPGAACCRCNGEPTAPARAVRLRLGARSTTSRWTSAGQSVALLRLDADCTMAPTAADARL
jgi:hypothetical protein